MGALRVCVSASAADRLSCARDLIRACVPGTRVLIVGASRGAADDLARERGGVRSGHIRAAALEPDAARREDRDPGARLAEGVTSSTWLGTEAVAARVAFDARRQQSLAYFEPVSNTPGFPRALARTLQELRLAGVEGRQLTRLPLAGPDLADLLDRVEASFVAASSADRAVLFRAAAARTSRGDSGRRCCGVSRSAVRPCRRARVGERAGRQRAVVRSRQIPTATSTASRSSSSIGGVVEERGSDGAGDLACLRRFLFNRDALPVERDARRLAERCSPRPAKDASRSRLRVASCSEARRGVRFDEMAILVRSPHSYFGLLEHALTRAGVPAWFDRGTRRPHPGRPGVPRPARLRRRVAVGGALRRVPVARPGSSPSKRARASRAWVAPPDEAVNRVPTTGEAQVSRGRVECGGRRGVGYGARSGLGHAAGAVALGEAARRGRRDRTRRRALAAPARRARRESSSGRSVRRCSTKAATRSSTRHHACARAARSICVHLRSRSSRRWRRGRARHSGAHGSISSSALVPRVLRTPAHVLRVLADLRPMAEVGPIDLDEARRVLAERLLLLETDPPARRYGRVFVGTPQQARGRSFRVVFVPGLAERMFPQKPREDPLHAGRPAAGRRSIAADAAPAARTPSASCCRLPPARRPSGCTSRIRGSS